MGKTGSASGTLRIGSIVIAFAATMIAMWSFSNDRLVWGGYNLAIAVVAIVVVAAIRGYDHG